ncbi:amino acid permease [Alicyclobacillus fastidiosus]|uniref:Amino acid permease n=1 Tax=Alicyclobacillus fastidiosus TaxID=392011 RepID=A0ABV5AG54_9BACL|nr:amino acid permease [Alicyclobacillus fastidiosus]WEH11754.1 amino acid permease [Alicyclobacillus fastidiosus]
MNQTKSVRTTPRQKAMGMPVQAKGTMSLSELILVGVGGIIGAGFFLGCGLPIAAAGPSVLISFVLGGLITAQVIGALSSVALDHPVEGAFKVYSDMYLGRYLGYMQGWTYYLTSILTISSEAVASAIFVHVWLPNVPLWVLSSSFAALILLINAFGVANFGRIESVMSVIKIAALVGFLVFVALMIFGVRPHTLAAPISMTAGSGFFPHGVTGIFQSMLIVIFSFAGIGVFATAAVELKQPKLLDKGAVLTIVTLTLLYVLSIGALLLILPWTRVSTNISPFVQALQNVHMRVLADILNAVILVASFSVMAGAVFSANQILASLGRTGEAPKLSMRTSKHRHTQYGALLFTTLGIAIFLTLSYVLPSNVYNFLVSASSFLTFFNYFMMLATFLSWRRKNRAKQVSKLAFGQPVSTFLTMAAVLFLAIYALTEREQRFGFYACVAMAALLSIAYIFTRKYKQDVDRPSSSG